MEGRLKYAVLNKLNPSPPTGYQEGVKQTWSRRLYKGNYYLMLAHGLATLIIAITSAQIDPPYTVFLDTLWTKTEIAPVLHDAWCCRQRPEDCPHTAGIGKNGEDYGTCDSCTNDCECKIHTKWSEWLECESRYVSEWQDASFDANGEQRMYYPVLDEVTTWRMWVLLLIFEAITCFCHWLCWYKHDTYMTLLDSDLQPIRWLEYHITASIMTVCVCALNRITDVYLLAALFLIGMYLNFTGGLAFEVIRHAVRLERFHGPILTTLIFTQWYLFFLAWLAFIFQFSVIMGAFYWIINPYLQLESGELWAQLFGFVEIVNWGLLGSFLIFPVIHIYQTIAVQSNWKAGYYKAEFCYIIASLISKFLLVGSIFYAAIERENETNSS